VPEPASLAIVIVSRDVREDLARCLDSIAAAPPARPTTVAVVDNASSDGTASAVRSSHPAVTVIDAGANLGFARANNVGIRATRSDLVLLLNPDTVVPAGAIDQLADALAAHADAAAAGPRLVDAEGRPELSFGPPISPWGEFRQRRVMRALARGDAWARRYVGRVTSAPGPRAWVSGACLLAWRRDLEAVGLFDERYFLYTEDADLCAAFRARGRRVIFVPSVTIGHLRGRSAAAHPEAAAQRRRESQLAFYRKHHPVWAPVLAWWLRRRGFDLR
jgi:N-acetylglucosaminyl-diphospho-decaprenol L-rhamnosyltransferase